MQDLGTASGPSNSLSSAGIAHGDWHTVGGGEAGHAVADPSDPDVVYAGEYFGILTRYDRRTRQARNVAPWPDNPSGHGASFPRYRFQWTAPIAVSPHDPKTVYHGGNVLFRTQDGGQTWTAISGDLTRDDETKQRWSGGPITGDNTGAEYYGTIFAVAESPREKGLSGRAGRRPRPRHPRRRADVDERDRERPRPARVGHGGHDRAVAVRRGGRLPRRGRPPDGRHAAVPVEDGRLREDVEEPRRRPAAGTSTSTRCARTRRGRACSTRGRRRASSYSPDDGATWKELKLNLPTVAVHDLVVKDDDLVVGTHGRSIWILDDLTPLREWSKDVEAKAGAPLHGAAGRALALRRARLVAGEGSRAEPAGRAPSLHYWLKDEPKGDVVLEILDEKGGLVRKLSSRKIEPETPPDDPDPAEDETPKKALPKKAGLQRAVWDLRYEGATKIKAAKIDSGDPAEGPMVLPGTYTAKLTVDGQSLRRRPSRCGSTRGCRSRGPTSRSSWPSRSRCART